jgi:NodT family efflux transporter outer membrane factor (OMF) lipoprotein
MPLELEAFMLRKSICLVFSLSPCLAVLLGGCTSLSEYVHNGFKVGPNYVNPPAPLADDWIEKRKDGEELTRWWKVFNDPILDELVCTAYDQNLTLRQAAARILEARAQLGIAVGTFFPQSQFVSGNYTTTALSRETVNGSSFTKQSTFGQWNYGFSLAWEVDFWGRFRRGIESAGANLDASVANYDDVLVTLLSDVASNYVQMRTLEKRIAYAKENVVIQADTMKKAEARLKGDKLGELTLEQAIALLKQTEAGVPELEISLQQTKNQIAVLLGIPPQHMQARLDELETKYGKRGIPTAAPEVALGIPADLLRRRPDIRRAERQAAAQCALIGVAQADFYPHISLSGTLGYSAQQFKNLFNPRAFNGAFGPSFQWEVLNYGRILNNVRLQDAKFQELTAAYQNQVLVAQQEVESGMVAFFKAKQRTDFQQKSVNAARKAADLSPERWYKTNDLTFTTVSLIQQNKVQQEDTLAQARGEIALGLIAIYKALGGGWQIRLTGCEPSAAPLQIGPNLSDDSTPASRPVARFGPPS